MYFNLLSVGFKKVKSLLGHAFLNGQWIWVARFTIATYLNVGFITNLKFVAKVTVKDIQ